MIALKEPTRDYQIPVFLIAWYLNFCDQGLTSDRALGRVAIPCPHKGSNLF